MDLWATDQSHGIINTKHFQGLSALYFPHFDENSQQHRVFNVYNFQESFWFSAENPLHTFFI